MPQEVLVDNARALVSQHDPEREILVFAQRLEDFARYWGFKPRACRPYRARTKGKDERGVAYVKRNAIAGREFSQLGGAGGPSGALDPRGGRRAGPWHHRRGAAGAV